MDNINQTDSNGPSHAHSDARGAANHSTAESAASHNDSSSIEIELFSDPDLSLIEARQNTLPRFPMDILSPAWEDWLQRASQGAGVSREHVVVPLLGVVSGLLGPSRRVRVTKSWSVPMTLWTAVIGRSGDRKTPGLAVTLRALDAIDRKNGAATGRNHQSYEFRRQMRKEALRSWRRDFDAARKADPKCEPPPPPDEAIASGKFITPATYTSDSSVAGILPQLERGRGALIVRDELFGLFESMRSHGKDKRAFWLECWDGNRHILARAGSSKEIDPLLVGIVGGFQPDTMARAFAGDDDGMYARFLFAWLSTPEYQPLTDDMPEVDPAFERALDKLKSLVSEDDSGNSTQARDVPLSDAARTEYEEFRRFVADMKDDLLDRESQWVKKAEVHVLRLAGTLAYLEWSKRAPASANGFDAITSALEPATIGEEFMKAAIRSWRDYFWPHARAALQRSQTRGSESNARRVLLWIKAQGKHEISREEIRRDCLGQSLKATDTQDLLETLEGGNWLKKTVVSTRGRPRHRWKVNPKLFFETIAKNQ
jgi:hypothetical protein